MPPKKTQIQSVDSDSEGEAETSTPVPSGPFPSAGNYPKYETQAEKARRRYHEDPEYRARRLEVGRQYRERKKAEFAAQTGQALPPSKPAPARVAVAAAPAQPAASPVDAGSLLLAQLLIEKKKRRKLKVVVNSLVDGLRAVAVTKSPQLQPQPEAVPAAPVAAPAVAPPSAPVAAAPPPPARTEVEEVPPTPAPAERPQSRFADITPPVSPRTGHIGAASGRRNKVFIR